VRIYINSDHIQKKVGIYKIMSICIKTVSLSKDSELVKTVSMCENSEHISTY